MRRFSAGRVRGLAAAVGVGAALVAGCGIAAADSGAPDATDGASSPRHAATLKEAAGAAAPGLGRVRGASAAARASRDATAAPQVRGPRPAAAGAATRSRGESRSAATIPAISTPPPGAARAAAVSSMKPLALRTPSASPADPTTTGGVALLGLTTALHMGIALAASALTPTPPSPYTATPTMHLGGVDLVPSSTREITSIYGRWTYLPGAPGLVQGRQQFDVVEPGTGQSLGSFSALVSRGSGIDYTELLVTSSDGAAAQVPPAGSVISNFQIGRLGLGYSAIPGPAGNVVSFAITTPSARFSLRVPLDAAAGIADRSVDNRPIELGNGYRIAPATPAGETLTAVSGVLPVFTTVQGHQVFSLYDPAGASVGSFDGVFTTTADIAGIYTQALLVTGNDGVNVGTAAGQVPPVGSVYNVIYRRSDAHFYLYSSLPSESGSQVSVIQVKDGQVLNSALTLIDASKPPATQTLSAAGGYRFVPVTALLPSGVNGLPPRDVQIQGYQRYDVYDGTGARIGSVDADVSTQWDLLGIHGQALLVTRVTEDVAGTVPPVGSAFNFVGSERGVGFGHSVQPLAAGDLTSFGLVTPFGVVDLASRLVPAPNRAPVSFFSPYTV